MRYSCSYTLENHSATPFLWCLSSSIISVDVWLDVEVSESGDSDNETVEIVDGFEKSRCETLLLVESSYSTESSACFSKSSSSRSPTSSESSSKSSSPWSSSWFSSIAV